MALLPACVSPAGAQLAASKNVDSWGLNGSGQLGNATFNSSPSPVLVYRAGVLSQKRVTAVSGGGAYALALCSDGTVASWGVDDNGQLGDGGVGGSSSDVPVAVDTSGVLFNKSVAKISAGIGHGLALCTDGTLVSWGKNNVGQLGNNGTANSKVPVLVVKSGVLAGKTVTQISAGGSHSLALCSDNTLVSWGGGTSGQLGNGGSTDSPVPVLVQQSGVLLGKTISAISSGTGNFSVVLCTDGTMAAWGDDSVGELGDGTNATSNIPVAVKQGGALQGKVIVSIAAGNSHCLALSSAGLVYGWGLNTSGQLGDGSNVNSSVARTVYTGGALSGQVVTAIEAGSAHSVALTSTGNVICWGLNSSGQLGDGTQVSKRVPVAVDNSGVLFGVGVQAIAAGASFTLTTDGVNAPTPALSVTDTSTIEGDSGTSLVLFDIQLNTPASTDVTVHYATADGSAVAKKDYTSVAGTATITAGSTDFFVLVSVVGDKVFEATESFTLNLSNPSGVLISSPTGTCTIFDNDTRLLPPGIVAYSSDRDGSFDIFTDLPDGSNPVQLTTTFANDTQPAISPDGTKIVFVSDRSGRDQLWLMNINGTGVTQLTFFNDRTAESPTWNPDGTTIAFNDDRLVNTVEVTNIATVPFGGGAVTTLTTTGMASHPSFSPDGKKLVYQYGGTPDMGNLVVMTVANRSVTALLTTGVARHPSWSPDGTKVVYAFQAAVDNFDIATVDANGANVTVISNSSADEDWPIWDPQQKAIAWQLDNGSGPDIWMYNSADGLIVSEITTGDNTHISWNYPHHAPQALSVSPTVSSTTVGGSQVFTAVYRDFDGYPNQQYCYLELKGKLDTGFGLLGRYQVATNQLWAWNGKAYVGGITPGVKTPIVVTQGSLNSGLCTVTKSGSDITIKWSVSPSATFTGLKDIFLKVTDNDNVSDGFKDLGDWTVNAAPAGAAPAPDDLAAPTLAPSAHQF